MRPPGACWTGKGSQCLRSCPTVESANSVGVLKVQKREEINEQAAWNFRKMGFGSENRVRVLAPSFISCVCSLCTSVVLSVKRGMICLCSDIRYGVWNVWWDDGPHGRCSGIWVTWGSYIARAHWQNCINSMWVKVKTVGEIVIFPCHGFLFISWCFSPGINRKAKQTQFSLFIVVQ